MADLFKEVIPSILQTKKSVLTDDVDVKEYVPFVVNRALSYHMDCVLYANELNMHPSIDKDMQYFYYLNSIRPMKRKFQPWQKASADKDLDYVKQYYGYNNQRAKEALRILNDEQLAEIKRRTDKGGT
jgi:hypothetical protein